MWTARFGILGSEETKKQTDDTSSTDAYLELDIQMNMNGNDIKIDTTPGKTNKYKPYFSTKNNKRKGNPLKRSKTVTVRGDGKISQKEVIR